VQCEGKPHFWVDSDGSYREEGQKHPIGNIWSKVWFPDHQLFSFTTLNIKLKTTKDIIFTEESKNCLRCVLSASSSGFVCSRTIWCALIWAEDA